MLNRFIEKLDHHPHPRKAVLIFLLIWLVINLIQAAFTGLANDEAYYWMYSRHLAWGYFDHPPMIAILVKMGYALFKNELGVRLLTTIMGVSTLYLTYLILEDRIKKISVFFMILLSAIIILSHIGGFLAIPDLPVVFFSVLFFFLYKKYLDQDTWGLACLLGITAAAMLYSKYHGVLVMFFVLISNLQILKRKTFWAIPAILVLAMMPHLYWQMANHFPTFQYHLVGRSSTYKFDHTFNYIYSQLLIAGPFAGLLLFYHAIRQKAGNDQFLRSMKFVFYGFFIFFFFSSFKGHVEAHWTAIAYVPVIILSYLSIAESPRAQQWLKGLFIPTFILFLFIRVALIVEIFPPQWNVGKEFHGWKAWAEQIKKEAQGRRVVFVNSFQKPSKYAFYTGGDFATTLNSVYYRKNQYDLWHFEDSIRNKPVLLMFSRNPQKILVTGRETYPVEYFDTFRSYYSLTIIPATKTLTVKSGSTFSMDLKIVNPLNHSVQVIQAKGGKFPHLSAVFHNGHQFLPEQYLQEFNPYLPAHDTLTRNVQITCPVDPGMYTCYFSVVNDTLYASGNCRPLKLKVVR
jgi:hypothetical protein